MGRRARNKQAAPTPLRGSDLDRVRKGDKGKRKAPSTPDSRKSFKAAKGVGAKSSKDRQRKVLQRRTKAVDVVDEDDSDLDDALQQGSVMVLVHGPS